MVFDPSRALQLLRSGSGQPNAEFRDGQAEAIQHVVDGKGRLLVVQKTGWGKSFVYFIAVKLLREQGLGPALLISPLLALMRNQLAAAQRMGVRAQTINSDNTGDWQDIERAVVDGGVDILLIAPERLANERFQTQVLGPISNRTSLIVVDEAHCISDWGHDFRPHYRLLERIVANLPRNLRVLATTATANARVMEDLTAVLGPGLTVSHGSLARTSLTLQTLRLPSKAARLAWIAGTLGEISGSGIIYALTRRDAMTVGDWLRSRGHSVAAYTSDTGEAREEIEQGLLENRYKAVVATSALGMGYDKPDLAFVIHYQTPGSVVAYYQQVGRAGRALADAYGILLSGEEEMRINDYFINNAFPNRNEISKVLEVLIDAPDGLSVPELLERVNLSKGRIDKTIELLSLESPAPIVKQGSKWILTTTQLGQGFWDRAERLTSLRRDEAEQMQRYVDLPFGQHMEFLIRALDGDDRDVPPPRQPARTANFDEDTYRSAVIFLQRAKLVIEPRKTWPVGGLPRYGTRGAIHDNVRAQPGLALCAWGDEGWGSLVRSGKYQDGRFSDELVTALAQMVREKDPQPPPGWVTAVPSRRHPTLVPDLASRLAAALGLPFHMVLDIADERPEQKAMENSVHKARNIDGALRVHRTPIPDAPVILVDDIVDSRWTLTVAAWLLRCKGAGEVHPIVLAHAGPAE
ncbi:MAG: RecQ family ATP-dependent DNA helicase [Thermohalobaculum sp.]